MTEYLTGVFKIHNPSVRRKAVMDTIFEAYTQAMSELLDYAEERIDLLAEQGQIINREGVATGKYNERSILPLLPSAPELDPTLASSMREALLKNTAGMIASFLELRKLDETTSWPIGRDPSPAGYPNALAEFCNFGMDGVLDQEAFLEAQGKLMTRAKSRFMPLYFSRYRDCPILISDDGQQFWAMPKLLPGNSPLAVPVNLRDGRLRDLASGEPVNYRGKAAVLLPLEVGKRHGEFHWQFTHFLKPVMDGKASIKAGKLIRVEDETWGRVEYYLHLSFAFDTPELYEPAAFLGVGRGLLYSGAWAVADIENGRFIASDSKDVPFREIQVRARKRLQKKQQRLPAWPRITRRDFKQRELDGILHRLVNELLDTAEKHQAMIVLEDLNIKHVQRFYVSAYKKLWTILDYKARLRGVPVLRFRGEPRWIFNANANRICPDCGHVTDVPDDWSDDLVCAECGAIWSRDEAAALNIARRPLYRKSDWPGGYLEFHRSFSDR